MPYADPEIRRAYSRAYKVKDQARWKHLNRVRVDHETWADLHAKAASTGVSVASLIRTYIEWGLENDA